MQESGTKHDLWASQHRILVSQNICLQSPRQWYMCSSALTTKQTGPTRKIVSLGSLILIQLFICFLAIQKLLVISQRYTVSYLCSFYKVLVKIPNTIESLLQWVWTLLFSRTRLARLCRRWILVTLLVLSKLIRTRVAPIKKRGNCFELLSATFFI